MSGVKGRSGTNKGKDKPWAEALRVVGFAAERKRLLAIAEQCFAAAEAGDIQAMREIGDRLDGKPAQESTVNVNRTDVRERTDAELAEILAGADRGGEGDANPPLNPSQLN